MLCDKVKPKPSGSQQLNKGMNDVSLASANGNRNGLQFQ